MARKALLCGINNYQSSPDLRGCINDVENLYRLLVNDFGFRGEEIRVLTDNKVTKQNLLQHWRWLTLEAEAKDTLIFHFSGHGSNVPDLNNDEADHRDEITCLYDMDFNNPESYLSDDEWYDLCQQVNPASNLIIIKDTCHSGGSTRLLGVQDNNGCSRLVLAETSKLKTHSVDEVIQEESVTNARFIIPPNLPTQAWRSAENSTTIVNPTRLSEVQQVSLMACKETQTAADAHIGGSFNGAFTYHLCQALRGKPTLSTHDLIEKVAERLRGNYEQIPQHEGKDLPGPIFGVMTESPAISKPQISFPSGLMPKSSGENQSTQQMLIQAYMKLLDTVTILQGDTRLSSMERGGSRVLVAVHGIGSHAPGYSNAWWQALQSHVGTTYSPDTLGQGRQEVVWSDLVNRSRSLNTLEVQQLRQSILDVIEDRRDHVAAQARAIEDMPTMRGSEIAIDDFLVYLLDNDIRQQIIDRFTTTVGLLLQSRASVDIISHSWGTVVAFEGLRELEQRSGLSGRVRNWFTVGSALSISPVQWRLRPGNRPSASQKAPRPALVDSWINLDAKGDLVGGRLSRKFPVDVEYLELTPASCTRRLWGYDLSCAHSSYFQSDNLRVNRDIFAQHILDSGSRSHGLSSLDMDTGMPGGMVVLK